MIRKIIIVVLTLAAVGALIPGCFSRTTSANAPHWCWCSDFAWKGQIAFEFGHMIVYKHMPASGKPTDWCDIQATAGSRDPLTRIAFLRGEFLRLPGLLQFLSFGGSWCLVVPLWCLFLLFGAYPTYAFLRGPVLRSWRRRRGLCVGCGYNLTGNESGVCPECGTEIEASRPC